MMDVCQSIVTDDIDTTTSHTRPWITIQPWKKNSSIETTQEAVNGSNTNTTSTASPRNQRSSYWTSNTTSTASPRNQRSSYWTSNTTSTASPRNQRSSYWTRICLITDSFVAFTVGPLGVLGVVGNVLSIAVLIKIRNRMSGWLILLMLAVCDSLFLILNFILKTLPVIAVTYLKVANFYSWFVYVIVYGWNTVTLVYSTGKNKLSFN